MQIEDTPPPSLALGQTRTAMIWKLVEYVGLISFIVIAPRNMGPDLYGRFAALLALIGLFIAITGLGALPTFGRFVPEYAAKGEESKIQAVFTQLFFVRVGVAGLLGVVFLFLFPRLLPGASPLTVAAGAGAFFCGAIATTCYQIFYGLNSLGRWLSQQALLKIFLLVLLAILGGWQSPERASLALFMTYLGFLLFGLFWARAYFTLDRSAFRFSFLFSHLRFGLQFFAANFLLMAAWRGGELMVLFISGRNAEVGFFNVASAVTMAFSALLGQLAFMITPSLTTLHISGKKEEMNTWLGYSLKYLTIASFSFLLMVHALGEWAVRTAMGEQFLPVVSNLKVLAFGLLPVALIRTGVSLAVVNKKPRRYLAVAVGTLTTFLIIAAVLVPRLGSLGAAVAIALAQGCAAVITYFQFPLVPVLAVARYGRIVLLGFVALGVLGALGLTSNPPALMGLVAIVIYIILLFWGKVLGAQEIRQIGQILVRSEYRNAPSR